MKEKGTLVKEGWGVLGSAMGVQAAMQELAKMEAAGPISEEEMEKLQMDLTSKVGTDINGNSGLKMTLGPSQILLVSWRATKLELISVLGEVVDRVLSGEKSDVLVLRAKAIMTVGGIFMNVTADESDEERRELER